VVNKKMRLNEAHRLKKDEVISKHLVESEDHEQE
jgi:hypothetical protein